MSKGFTEPHLEIHIYHFCKRKLLPLFRHFLKEDISWTRMIQQDYSDEKVVEKFRKEIVNIVKEVAEK